MVLGVSLWRQIDRNNHLVGGQIGMDLLRRALHAMKIKKRNRTLYVSAFVANAPSRNPPSGVSTILSRGSRVMSTRWDGRETFSFIRSSRFVPPAMNFALAVAATSVTAPSTLLAIAKEKLFMPVHFPSYFPWPVRLRQRCSGTPRTGRYYRSSTLECPLQSLLCLPG